MLNSQFFCQKQNKIIELSKMAKSFLKNLKHQYQKYQQADICCICGLRNCEQAIDHQKLNLEQLNETIIETLRDKDKIQEIKQAICSYYKEIKISLVNLIQKDEYELMTYINKFYFSEQISQNSKVDIGMICEIMEKNVSRLPSKKLAKLLCKLQSIPKYDESSQLQILTLKQRSQRFMQKINIPGILSTLKPILPLSHFKDQLPQLKLKSRTSLSQLINPQQTDMVDQNKIYEWRNVRVTKNSRTVSLSNKNISDKEVMEQIPILANYKNLKQLEIRNNKISCFSCHLIANNMPFLHSIDIRGNRITDKGIIKLINRIPNLKSFSISETQATDQTGNQIANKLHLLEIFWSEHTQITNQVALKIAQKPKLKVLSLLGNPIDDQYKEKMKKIFISKGYIAI